MEIPPNVQIISTIREGSVFYFVEETFHTDKPHYFVVLNHNPRSDSMLLLVCATTLEGDTKRADHYASLSVPRDTLVDITPAECHFLKKISLFDCNHVTEKTIDELIEKLDKKRLEIRGIAEPKILDRLRMGVLKSPLIEPRLKKILQNPF